MIRRLSISLLALSALVAGANHARAQAPRAPIRMRVLVWDIGAAERGLDQVIETLRRADPDLVVLQDVDRLAVRSGNVHQAQVIADALGFLYAYRSHDGIDATNGLAVVSRWPVGRIRPYAMPHEGTISLGVRIPFGDRTVSVLDFHLPSVSRMATPGELDAADKMRLESAQVLLGIARREPGAVLVMGNLGDADDSAAYHALAGALTDACVRSGGGGAGLTWPSGYPIARTDFVFVSHGVTAARCGALPTDASAHRPVVADIEVRR